MLKSSTVIVQKADLEAFNMRYTAIKDANLTYKHLVAEQRATIDDLRAELEAKDKLLKEALTTIKCAMYELEKPKICYLNLTA